MKQNQVKKNNTLVDEIISQKSLHDTFGKTNTTPMKKHGSLEPLSSYRDSQNLVLDDEEPHIKYEFL